MSSTHQYMQNSNTKDSTVVRLGDIEHLSQLSENLSSLCLSHEYSDITLIVEGQKLYAHKVKKANDNTFKLSKNSGDFSCKK